MKRLLLTSLLGLAALSLSPLANAARVNLNIGIGIPGLVVGPPPVVYAPAPVYAPPPVVYGVPYYGYGYGDRYHNGYGHPHPPPRDWHHGPHR